MLYPQNNGNREAITLDGLWKFNPDPDSRGEKEKWYDGLKGSRKIAVPGSWNEQYVDLYKFHGKGWYEKKFYPAKAWEGKSIYLRFGSVTGKTIVWLNGQVIMKNEGAHLPFECEVSEYLVFGKENSLTLMSDNTLDPWALPPAALREGEGREGFLRTYPGVSYDFFPYSGIHRSVWLYCTDKTRIEDIVIKTEPEIGVVSYIVKLSAKAGGKLKVTLDGKTEEIVFSDTNEVTGKIQAENVRLWDVGKPELYDLDVELETKDSTDLYKQTFGFRKVEIRDEKLYLNGKPVFLKGFGKHEDFHITGRGFQPAVMVKDYDLMKWIGANSYRTSHYPYDEQMLDYADRTGMLIIDETPFVGLNERMYKPEILEKAKKIINKLIERDKNHPSVILWSLANEPYAESENAEMFFKEMAETARKADDTRPITYVMHDSPQNNVGMKYYDIMCLNRYHGWYVAPGLIDESMQNLADSLDEFHDIYKKGMIITEYGADAVAGMHSLPEQMFSEEYQAEIIEKQYRCMKNKPYMCGVQVWAFADFATAQGTGRVMMNRKGVFTRERYPKMAAHTLRKLWNEEE